MKINFSYVTNDENGRTFGVVPRGHEGLFSRLDSRVYELSLESPVEIIRGKKKEIIDKYCKARKLG